jgi:SM-20-related protein
MSILTEHELDQLVQSGWVYRAEAFSSELCQAARSRIEALQNQAALRPARVGRAVNASLQPSLRGDLIHWLAADSEDQTDQNLLAHLDELRLALNASLFLGLREVEAHYACYAAGQGYAKHLDRFRDNDARVLSLVLYFNTDWPTNAGGELKLHLPEGERLLSPNASARVIFRSEQVLHEVMPAQQARYSLAAWFRV